MGRLTRLSLFTSILGAGVGACVVGAGASAMAAPAFAAPAGPFFSGGSAAESTAIPETAAVATAPTVVVVRPGDTMSGIGNRLGVAWPALGAYNQLDNPDLIYPGQQLLVPPAGWTAPPPSPSPQPAPSASGFEQCVIQRESGGNPDARNGPYWGLYQFTYSTWVANGGNPADYGTASPAAQHAVFAHTDPSNWAPYDGC